MKRLALVIALTFTLTGCSEPAPPAQGERVTGADEISDIKVIKVDRGDGRKMDCVLYRPFNGGGIDCDWTAR